MRRHAMFGVLSDGGPGVDCAIEGGVLRCDHRAYGAGAGWQAMAEKEKGVCFVGRMLWGITADVVQRLPN